MKNFTIPKPCHENWDKMLPDEKGKFCASCQKSVYDFTQNSNKEIKEIFDQEKGKVCGRFRDEQLIHFSKFQKIVLRIERFSQNNFSKFGTVISAVSLLMSISGCQKKTEVLGGLAPVNTDGDSTTCIKDTINEDFIMGEMIAPRLDSAQIDSTKKPIRKNVEKKLPSEATTTVGVVIETPEIN